MKHDEPSPLAMTTVTLGAVMPDARGMVIEGAQYHVEDWWDRVSGQSWMSSDGNPAAMQYAIRSGMGGGRIDDEVLYGKIDGFGHLVHISEIAVAAPVDESADAVASASV
jgi:hypothetical protein